MVLVQALAVTLLLSLFLALLLPLFLLLALEMVLLLLLLLVLALSVVVVLDCNWATVSFGGYGTPVRGHRMGLIKKLEFAERVNEASDGCLIFLNGNFDQGVEAALFRISFRISWCRLRISWCRLTIFSCSERRSPGNEGYSSRSNERHFPGDEMRSMNFWAGLLLPLEPEPLLLLPEEDKDEEADDEEEDGEGLASVASANIPSSSSASLESRSIDSGTVPGLGWSSSSSLSSLLPLLPLLLLLESFLDSEISVVVESLRRAVNGFPVLLDAAGVFSPVKGVKNEGEEVVLAELVGPGHCHRLPNRGVTQTGAVLVWSVEVTRLAAREDFRSDSRDEAEVDDAADDDDDSDDDDSNDDDDNDDADDDMVWRFVVNLLACFLGEVLQRYDGIDLIGIE
mmetsp:Transcript_24643/g.68038  ORF Transcript_24643/g.68038 Transcript_24643/m.68038 type:complete len:398 (+) Transcript_24643:235-1428(+)